MHLVNKLMGSCLILYAKNNNFNKKDKIKFKITLKINFKKTIKIKFKKKQTIGEMNN